MPTKRNPNRKRKVEPIPRTAAEASAELMARREEARRVADGLPWTEADESAWENLVREAEAGLDESGLERLEKRRAAARRMPERFGGWTPTLDLVAVKRALVVYRTAMDSGTGGFESSCRSAGCAVGDALTAFDWWPDTRSVYEFVRRRRGEANRMRDEEALSAARSAQRRLLTEDGCGLNGKMAMFTLERLDRAQYGQDDRRSGHGADEGAKTVYRISGVTINAVGLQGPMGGVVMGALAKPAPCIEAEDAKDGERS